MSLAGGFRQHLCAVLAAACLAVPAGAATIQEPTTGGGFSGSYSQPTVIHNGFEQVNGTGTKGTADFIEFDGLARGPQTISFTFSAPANPAKNYTSGGQLYYSFKPFDSDRAGTQMSTFALTPKKTTETISFAITGLFYGKVYFGIYFTHGQNLAYRIDAPGNAPAPPSVPLPASALLLGCALAAAGGLRAWRRVRQRA